MLEQIKKIVETGLDDVAVTVTGDGSHFDILVVGKCFEGKTLLQKQKMVNATLADKITSGEIHAVTIKTYTPDEWQKASRFQVGGG